MKPQISFTAPVVLLWFTLGAIYDFALQKHLNFDAVYLFGEAHLSAVYHVLKSKSVLKWDYSWIMFHAGWDAVTKDEAL